jgi:predicted DNA-binding WGR domain protein
MSKRYFEFTEGSSSKFWEIWKDGTEVFTRYGKIGASGATTVKDEGSDAKAQKLYDKLVNEKTKKGYEEKTASGTDDDDDDDDDDDNDADDDADDDETVAAPPPPPAPVITAGARYFEFTEGSSSKFWEIRIDGTEVFTRYGKIGASGATTVKDEGSDAKAQKLYDKLVKEKTGKGYVEKGSAGADDDDDNDDAGDADDADDTDEDDESEDTDGDDSHLDGDAGSRRFEHGGSKFWEIRVEGSSHTVKFGKVGTNGQEKTKDFASPALAQKDADKLIAEKTNKGYEEV